MSHLATIYLFYQPSGLSLLCYSVKKFGCVTLRNNFILAPKTTFILFIFKAWQQAHSKICNCCNNIKYGQKDKQVNEIIGCTFLRALFLFAIFFSSSSVTLAAESSISHFVYLQDGIDDSQSAEKQIAIKVWNEWVAQNGDFNISTHSAATMPDFFKLIKNQKIDYALMDGSNFVRYYNKLKPILSGEAWGVQRSDKAYEEYVLLTRKGGNVTEINELKGTTLSLYPDYGLLRMYLDKLIMNVSHTSLGNFFNIIREVQTESQAILDVFFGYSDVCLVSKHVLDAAVELNPAIRDKVKIIHRSGEKYVPVIYIAFNNVSDIEQSRFNKAMNKLNNTTRGKQLLNLFGIQAIKKINQEKLYPMLELNTPLH
jgi:ABC-type phosphate/phosphonate transport system substrate-binding protein